MKNSPIEEIHKARNATFVEDHGWHMPLHFGDPDAEYRAVRSQAGWLDLANRSVLSFSGPDTVEWLQGMLSNDVRLLRPGTGARAAVLNIQGKILADVRVLCTEDEFLIDLWEFLTAGIVEHLEHYLIADEVEVKDRSPDLTCISLQGPAARGVLAAMLDIDRLPSPDLEHLSANCDGNSVRVVSISHTGEDGFDLWLPRVYLEQFLTRARAESGADTTPWIGLEAQQILRIEAGIPLYGVDMNAENLLLETGLDNAVSFTKGCYLGQEVVERIRSRGHVNKKLAGIACNGEQVPQGGDRIVSDSGEDLGHITSAVFSPHSNRPIALGYLAREHAVPGKPVAVQHGDQPIPAVVAELPFYSRV